MKASELRLGNLVVFKNKPLEFLEVSGLANEKVWYAKGKYLYKEEVEPIPLTEEWLLKFGFTEKKYSFRTSTLAYIFNDFAYLVNSKTVSVFWNPTNDNVDEKYTGWLPCANNIEYVHQLQNLFFALTGAELTIKQPA